MKVCPSCGYRDGIYWRPRHFDTAIDIAKLEDVQTMSHGLGVRLRYEFLNLRKNRWRCPTIYDGIYGYRVTRSGMVWRKEKEFLDSEGWAVPSDGAGSKKSAAFKRAISKRTTK